VTVVGISRPTARCTCRIPRRGEDLQLLQAPGAPDAAIWRGEIVVQTTAPEHPAIVRPRGTTTRFRGEPAAREPAPRTVVCCAW
jgi:hypothetical protein